jgi:hypothetical protein
MLHTLVHKMSVSPLLKMPTLLNMRRGYFESHTHGALHRVMLTEKELKVTLCGFMHSNCSVFRLLQDYGGGRDGRVWLVASKASETNESVLGVIKMPKKQRQVDDASSTSPAASPSHSPTPDNSSDFSILSIEEEAVIWQSLLRSLKITNEDKLVRTVKVSGTMSLLMPFVFHLREEWNELEKKMVISSRFSYPDHHNPDTSIHIFSDVDRLELAALVDEANANKQAIANEAIESFANAGYEHRDVRWRHIGFLVTKRDNGKLERKPLLIDLAAVIKLHPTQEAKEEAINNMRDMLDNDPCGLCNK